MTVSDTTYEIVVAALGPLEVELYDVEHTGGTLRVTIDRPDGIDIEALTAATRAVPRALDEADPIPGSYHLEVSSPGLERPLRTLEHWRGAIGERVKVKTDASIEGDRRIEGAVAGVGDDEVTVRSDDDVEHTIRLADVERARTVFEWGPAPKPGGPKPGGPKGGHPKSGGQRAGGKQAGGKQADTKSPSGRTKENQT